MAENVDHPRYLNEDQIAELERLFHPIKDRFTLRMIRTSNKKNLQKFYYDISFLQNQVRLSQMEIEELVDKRLLKFTSKKEKRLTLTLKAILVMSHGITDPSNGVEELLNNINAEFFEKILGTIQPLASDEKAVIIAMLGLGALSEEYLLKVSEKNEGYFRNAVDLAVDFLRDLGSESDEGKLDNLWTRNVVGEGPVLGLMRRTNKIPIRTENIYVKQRKGHYLDLLAGNEIDEQKFMYLLSRLFHKKPLTFSEKKNLIKRLDEIQRYEFRIFKNVPPFDSFGIRKQMKRLIEHYA